MQLKKISIRNKLALATSTLLISTPMYGQEASLHQNEDGESHDSKEINVSTSYLSYAEEDRISVKKWQGIASIELGEDHVFRADLIYDTISGVSPNGRIFTDNAASDTLTLTTASGLSSLVNNTTSNGNKKTWLSDDIEDTRKAINVEWEYSITRLLTTTLGVGTSTERDYESYSGSGNLAYEFNQRRTTLNLGAAISNDTIDAFVGIPDGLTTLICTNEAKTSSEFRTDWLECPVGEKRTFKSGNKITTDYLIGFTQVWNRRTILQANYARGKEDGYLTDPYKQISLVKPGFGEAAVLYEKRPRSRNTNSLFFKIVNVPFDKVSVNLSYRFFWDDWDVRAHTVDGRLRFNINHKIYIQCHGRLHRQGAASFYDRQISIDSNSGSFYAEKPNFISADTRLGKLISATAGVKVGYKMNEKVGFSARVERMQQHYYGALPRLKVWIAQLIVNVKF